jgi:lipoate synthase
MATFNLVRNSRVFFTTNVAAGTGLVAGSGFTTANTQEIQVMDLVSHKLLTLTLSQFPKPALPLLVVSVLSTLA